MDMFDDFLMFSSDGKVLALKLTQEWSSCEAFIYNIENETVTYLSDKKYPSYERFFFAMFFAPMSGSVCIIDKEDIDKNIIPQKTNVWKFNSNGHASHYPILKDEIEKKSNKNKNVDIERYEEYRKE